MSTSNAANRCLALNEIARQIAFTFDAEQDGSTLLNLALTSRVLLEPALDALWNRLDDWTCLLKLLPEEILQTEGDNIVFRHPPVAGDWIRFKLYSHRVRSIEVRERHSGVSSAVFEALPLHYPTRPLFPKLHCLDWFITDTPLFRHATLFLGENIQEVTIRLSSAHSSPDIATVMQHLVHRCPQLNRLFIASGGPGLSAAEGKMLSSQLAELIASHKVLRVLRVHQDVGLEPSAVRQLALLPHLTELELSPTHLDPVCDVGQQGSLDGVPGCFLSLEYLNGQVGNPESLPGILRRMRGTALQHLRLRSSFISAASLAISFTELARFRDLKNLTLMFVVEGHLPARSGGMDSDGVGGAIFRPLLSLARMEVFQLSHPYLKPDDELLRAISISWPYLRTIMLRPYMITLAHLTRTPMVTFQGLQELVRTRVPHGHDEFQFHVQLQVDASSAHSFTALPNSCTLDHLTMNFLASNISSDDVQPVTSALVSLGANCKKVNMYSDNPWYQSAEAGLASAAADGLDFGTYHNEIRRRQHLWAGIARQVSASTGSR